MEKKRTVDELVEEIKALTPGEKLVLFRKMKESGSKEEQEEQERKFFSSFGGWKGKETAEELIRDVYESRTIGPEREPLDE